MSSDPSHAMSLARSADGIMDARRAIFIAQRHHRGFLASFEADAAQRLQWAYRYAQMGEDEIYRYARLEHARDDTDEYLLDPVVVGYHCDNARHMLVWAIREYAPELVGRGHTSFQVFDSIYRKVRRNAVAKMKRGVNLGRARRRAGY